MVQVSADLGKTWKDAEITGKDTEYCWQLWKAKINVNVNTKRLVLRAQDSSGGFMPGRVPWNAQGLSSKFVVPHAGSRKLIPVWPGGR